MDHKPSHGRPGGRPRKDNHTLRDQWLRARVTAQEKHRAEQLMRDAKKTESDFVRDAVLEGRIEIGRFRTVEPIVLHDLGRLAQEISRAGNVVNQVATIAHSTGNLRRGQMLDAAVAELSQALADIRPLLKHLHELE
jgi:hypothetical protein